jgi:hypothetical protein
LNKNKNYCFLKYNYYLSKNTNIKFLQSFGNSKINSLFLMKKTKDENINQMLKLFLDFGYYSKSILLTYSGIS